MLEENIRLKGLDKKAQFCPWSRTTGHRTCAKPYYSTVGRALPWLFMLSWMGAPPISRLAVFDRRLAVSWDGRPFPKDGQSWPKLATRESHFYGILKTPFSIFSFYAILD